jgi:HEPN domain-containing protein
MRDALEQAARDIEVATSNAAGGYYEWSAYAARQGAAKAVCALLPPQPKGDQSVEALLARVAPWLQVPGALQDAARELDQAARDFTAGESADAFSEATSRQLIGNARAILEFCRSQIGSSDSRGPQ